VALAIGAFAIPYLLTKGSNTEVTPALINEFYKGKVAADIAAQIKTKQAEGIQFTINKATGTISEVTGGRSPVSFSYDPNHGSALQEYAYGKNITQGKTKVTLKALVK